MTEGHRYYTEAELQKAIKRNDAGETWEEIAEDTGRSVGSLRSTCYNFQNGNWKGSTAKWKRKRNVVLRRLGRGESVSDIAKALKVSQTLVERVRQRGWMKKPRDKNEN